MKITHHVCEQCGSKVDPERESLFLAAVVQVKPPDPNPRPVEEYLTLFEVATGRRRPQQQATEEERFELCTSCGVALLIALKQVKLRVKRGQKREME